MYASRHAVYAGPGRLPKELRELLLKRQGAPQSDLATQSSRLISFFETAAEAEKVASQLQRLKIASVVAGPEQPPPQDAWLPVETVTLDGGQVRAGVGGAEERVFAPEELAGLTVVDWRPVGQVDRAALLRVTGFARPLFFRATTLKAGGPHGGLRALTALIDHCSRALPASAPLRQRRLTPEAMGAPTLSGDLLPLALAFIDAVEPPAGGLVPSPSTHP